MKPQVARDRKKLKLNAEVAELRQRTQRRSYPSALNAFTWISESSIFSFMNNSG
jgi:hypothetical protein